MGNGDLLYNKFMHARVSVTPFVSSVLAVDLDDLCLWIKLFLCLLTGLSLVGSRLGFWCECKCEVGVF